ncbi:oligosaccharyl transferase, STT3 subunit [Thermococcus siculi]|uniref:dolichyl-phosphooligosaccharide-protein glycotransferase n=1 Tax=Thermococcus siculi TaxID=72803 RepID=A0A2Z2MIS3_9EURY|nr:glycosyltransferase family 39 protein [Thermococcus siculi]ASJ08342.1 oligosaccharyl transferase, STT3 subunit [Thermococcus siculi]
MSSSAGRRILKKLGCIMRTGCFLPILIFVGLALRLIPLRFRYLLGYDTYFHAAYVEYSTMMGEWVNFFPYANAPWGMLIDQFHPKGFWMPPAYLHALLSPFGVSIDTAFKITPAVVGILTIIAVYFAVKSLYNDEVAVLSSLFMAISFGHVFRSMTNYYRGDNYLLFWYSLALLGLGLAVEFRGKAGWEYKRLALYVIPGLAAGAAAAFWSAYYLMFVFLIANAVFIAIGAFLLRKEWAFLDSTALTVSTILGALMANTIGSRLGYGMFGWNRPDGIEAAKALGLQFGFIKDAFLLVYLEYAVPAAILGIIILFGASRFIKSYRGKLVVTSILVLLVLFLGIRYYHLIKGAFLLFLQRFGEEAIAETRRTSFHDVWISYGTLIFVLPPFLLRFRPSRVKVVDFIVLGFAVPSLIMILVWSRFLFIGSLAVAILAGVGVWELLDTVKEGRTLSKRYFSTTIATTIIALLIVPTAAVATQNTINVRPFMNEGWENALATLREASNENAIILTWWDQGYWTMYYSKRGTPSHGAPDEFVAKYYLNMTNEKELMARGIDYVIVSYDTVRKFPAVLKTANVPVGDYPMIPMPLTETSGKTLVFAVNGYSITAEPGKKGWKILVSAGNNAFSPVEAYVEGTNGPREVNITGTQKADAYVYINLNYGYAVLMNRKSFETTLARLMFTDSYPPNYSLVYSDGGYIKIFKFEHPNVAVIREGDKIVLRFTKPVGTRLMVEGFLDNGTRVFFKNYDVSGVGEFVLPDQLNGSAVVRYSYIMKGEILDRGVFRLKDVGGRK